MSDEWTTEELATLVLNDRCPIDLGVAARHLAREFLRLQEEKAREFDRGAEEARRQLAVKTADAEATYNRLCSKIGELRDEVNAQTVDIQRHMRTIEKLSTQLQKDRIEHIAERDALKAQRDAAMQRGFDIAREYVFIEEEDVCMGDVPATWIEWATAEAELAKEMKK